MDILRRAAAYGLTPLIFLAGDLACLAVTFSLSVTVRYVFGGEFHPALYFSLWPAVFLFIIVYAGLGLYPGVLLPPSEELKRSFWGTSLIFLVLGSAIFMVKGGVYYSRLIFLWSWLLAVVGIPLTRSFIRHRFAGRRWWGYPVVTLGSQGPAARMISTVKNNPRMGLRPALFVPVGREPEAGEEIAGVPAIGLSRFYDEIKSFACGYAIVIAPKEPPQVVEEMIERLGHHFGRIILVPDLLVKSSLWAQTLDLNGILGLELKQKLLDPSRRIIKRLLDLALTFAGGAAALPLVLAIAVAIKLEGPGPVLYRQRRIGVGGREVNIFKFRTMVRDADKVLAEYLDQNEELRSEWERCHKIKCDPRITGVGRFLRKYSLDELPQLLNVVKGDLSLVGPRPIVEREIDHYQEIFPVYRRVRPGLTGLWQVSGRNDLSYERRVALDNYYIRNWSVWLDIYILAKTIPTVLKGDGAY